MTPHGVPQVVWAQAADTVAASLGIRFPPARWADLQHRLEAVCAESGEDVNTFVHALVAGTPDRARVQLLARHVTVGETYFFRDPELWAALRTRILPDLIRSRRGTQQRLRLWSAGCASGEEAWSLAIVLHQLLPDLREWEVVIMATDVNTQALRKGSEGSYGTWSFRGVPDSVRHLYFRPDGGDRYAVADALRPLVRFQYLNLVDDVFPAPSTGTAEVDLILCRNVLLYLTPAHREALVGRLRSALHDSGWLAVSATETSTQLFAGWSTVMLGGAIFYREQETVRRPACTVPSSASIPPPRRMAVRPAPARPVRDRRQEAEAASLGERARSLADAGQHAEALRLCTDWTANDNLQAQAHYLRGMICMESRQAEAARAALDSALFLEPDFVLAHVALASLSHAQGWRHELPRHLANSRRLLQALPPQARLPDGAHPAVVLELLEALGEGAT